MSVPSEPRAGLVREWAACGIVAAVSRFVPVPLLDDVVKERATRLAVARTLKAHGRSYDVTDVEVLYTGTDGWFAGARKYMVGIPTRIVLFPVRKYVAVFGAVRGVPTDVMAVILLARTVHRSLERGELAATDEKALRREARRVRKAYDAVFDEMDLRLLSGALQDTLSSGRELASAASDFAQKMVERLPGRHHSEDGDASLEPDADPELERGAEQVEDVLRRPEISALMKEFDHRVDAYLGVHP